MKILQYIAIIVIFLECTTALGIWNSFKSLFKKTNKKQAEKEEFNPLKYLDKYGYSLGIKTRKSLLASPYSSSDKKIEKNTEFNNMIRLFQSLFHLEVTGKLDTNTITQMKAPRCGFPDIVDKDGKSKSKVKTTNKLNGQRGPSSYVLSSSKWQNTDLKYKFINYNKELGVEGTRHALNKAFNYWATHADISFKEVCDKCEADFVIEFGEGNHGDGYPFDGQSGVLAHAFFPTNGKIHFDEAEHFTEHTKEGINLRLVAAHEIGHALGLEHSYDKSALMFPYYSGYVPLNEFDLDQDDILGIRSLYGKRKEPLTTSSAATKLTNPTRRNTLKRRTTTKRIPIYTTPTNETSPCNTKQHIIESAFMSPDNNIFVIVNHDELWKYKIRSNKWSHHDLLRVYKGIESGVRGGVKCKKGLTWFFKDRRAWVYKGYKLQSGYPKRITDPLYPSNPYTAALVRGQMYILKGSFAYKFNTEKLSTDLRFPTRVSKVFRGIPKWIEASLKYKNEHYMFKGELVYKVKITKTKQYVLKGYPKKIKSFWFPCIRR